MNRLCLNMNRSTVYRVLNKLEDGGFLYFFLYKNSYVSMQNVAVVLVLNITTYIHILNFLIVEK